MHSPRLFEEILKLRIHLTLCDPKDTAAIWMAIEEKAGHIATMSFVAKSVVMDGLERNYPRFLREQVKSGKIQQNP